MPTVRLHFGDGPEHWQPRLRSQAILGALLAMVPYLAAVTQMPFPERAFSFSQAPFAVIVGMTALVSIAVILGVAAWLLWRKNAVGVVIFAAGLVYIAPMISALAIAIVPMASGAVALATLLLILWSFWRLVDADRRIGDAEIAALARERIVVSPNGPVLAPSSAFPEGGLLTELQSRQGGGAILALELAAAFVVALAGPVLIPLTITGQYGGPTAGMMLVWFLCVAVFLGARKQINAQLLILRVIRRHSKP